MRAKNAHNISQLSSTMTYVRRPRLHRFPRKVGVVLALGVFVVAVGVWWASKV